jgi:hypothetical protein
MLHVKIDLHALDRLKRRISALHGTYRVPVSEILSPSFMRGCSRFSTFHEMIDASPFAGQDFDAIPDAAWDAYVRQHTRFASWQAMLQDAAADWTSRQLLC